MNNGVTVNSGDKFKALIDKIATLADNEGNKVQFVTGFINTTTYLVDEYTTRTWIKNSFTFDSSLDFTPTRLILSFPMLGLSQSINDEYYLDNYTVDSQMCYDKNNYFHAYESNCNSSIELYITNISNTGFDLYANKYTEYYPLVCPEGINWLAIGVEEDSITTEEDGALIKEGSLTDLGVTNAGTITYSERGLKFTPSLVYATLSGVTEENAVMETMYYNTITFNSRNTFTGTSEYNTIRIKIVENGFDIILEGEWLTVNTVKYLAIGPIIKIMVDSTDNPTDNPYPPGTNVNNTVTKFSAYQYNPVTKSIPVEADGNYTLSFDYGPNISNQGYTASVTVRVCDANGSTVDSYNKSSQYSSYFSKDLSLKKGYTIQITASISATTNNAHCNQVSDIKLIFNSL
jgi:hypothetical protein